MRSVLLGALILLGGCPKNLNLDLSKYKPTVRYERLELGKADWTGVDTTFVLKVDNPNPVGVTLASWGWDLNVAGKDFLKGNDRDGAKLEAQGSSELALPVRVGFSELIETAKAAKGQAEVPFVISGELGFATPLGVITVPWRDEGKLPTLARPKVTLTGLRVASFEPLKGRAELELGMNIQNVAGGRLDLRDAAWNVVLGENSVADGKLPAMATVDAGATQELKLPLGINLLKVAATVASRIQKKEPVPVGFKADLTVGTPLGALPLEIDERTDLPVR